MPLPYINQVIFYDLAKELLDLLARYAIQHVWVLNFSPFYFNSRILTVKAKQRLGLRETVGPLCTVPRTYICVRK